MAKFHTLEVEEVKRETPETVSVTFTVPEHLKSDFAFEHGQNLTLKAIIGGEDIRRSYSICTSPSESILKVAIKQQPFGKFSTFANEVLKTGDTLDVMTPMGKFNTPLDPKNKKNYVAFAAGSGITPILSIIKTTLETESNSKFTLFYGNQKIETIIFKEEIEALKNIYMGRFSVHYLLSQEITDSPLFNGRINSEKCKTFFSVLLDPTTVDEFFICGPEEMIHSVKQALLDEQIDARQIHFELFTSPAGKLDFPKPIRTKKTFDSTKESQIAITVDGLTYEFNLAYSGDNVLNAALEKGADLPFACKGGVCATCRAKVVEGEVEMALNYALVQDEIDAGYILTCQAHPRTEKLVVDFDV
ncbi:MAG: 1,2-phenylacetyl-CoA epoxidase subunit PaaE [Bacteroidota bacterium]